MLHLYKDLEETNEKQRDHSSKQGDPNNSDNTTHNYNLHSRKVHRVNKIVTKGKHDQK